MTNTVQIFTTQTTDGGSLPFYTNGEPIVKIKGTFDGATVSLQANTNSGNDDFSDTGIDEAFVSDAAFNPAYKQTLIYRLYLSDAGASTSIDAFVIE